ncbi:MAG: TonB-dependent receptor [Terracidiphilus sp.]|nr:TonB-dependent receptor [Terracidiphilus sp.]
MRYRLTRRVLAVVWVALAALFLAPTASQAQTFRGGINGSVTDQSGAVVPSATVEAVQTATGTSRKTVTSSAGEYVFQDLPLGAYKITVSAAGFKPSVVSDVPVTAGTIYTLPVKLGVESTGETVEVAADALALDTTTATETTVIPSETVQNTPMNGRDFTQMVALAPGFGGYSAGGFGSVNGSRANQVNWQIDGVDNNDLWHNVPAVNQGGVSGIAGITLPLDSIEEYSQQTQSGAEAGRNAGGTVNLATKSGTNAIHGSLYYYNRNEYFSANNPFNTGPKDKLRNQQYGASVGGPIKKDKLFYFLNYEKQQFVIDVPDTATEPSTAWQDAATAYAESWGVPASAMTTSKNVLAALWPANALTGTATTSNYPVTEPTTGYSYNGFGRVDYTINDKNSLSLHMFGGQGDQTSYVGSKLVYYFETAPIHVYNYSAVWNSTLSSRFTNQVLAGVNYFNQVFFDVNHSFDMASLGWNTDVSSALSGAPAITISGFDGTSSATPPSGRNDITGHLDDAANYTIGKHQLRFGGEFRRAYLNEFYHRKMRGAFKFDGSEGPWGAGAYSSTGAFAGDSCSTAYGITSGTQDTTTDSHVLALADFLAGCTHSSSIARGNPEREVYVNNYNLFFADSYQVTPKLNLNLGVRYDFLGPLHNSTKDLSVFLFDKGIVFQGNGISSLYPAAHNDFSPRVGISYQAKATTVIRAGFGMYFDQPNLNPFLDNRPPNGGASGAESNPGGASPVGLLSASHQVIAPGAELFSTSAAFNATNSYGLFSVSQNFRSAYSSNFSLNVEQQLSSKVQLTIGYVGSQARKLLSIHDINQAPVGSSGLTAQDQNALRPYALAHGSVTDGNGNTGNPYGPVNQIASIGNSNYNSLQTILKTSSWHGMTSQFTYTWGHGLDEMTQYRNAVPQDSTNFKGEYGSMDYDTRNNFNAYINYTVPKFQGPNWLSNGWQLNSLFSFHSGQPFTVYTGDDTSGTGEGADRPNQVAGLSVTGDRKLSGGVEQYFTNATGAYVSPSNAFGTLGRNSLVAPGFSDVDFSVFKNGNITERIKAQFRVEFFNLFNHTNLAPPDNYLSDGDGFGQITTTIGNYNGAPGIGPGEPFNTQLALKIIF